MLEIGTSLRERRQARGFEFADVEESTLIRGRYLEALEQEQFELLPAGSYRRSFLREYAEFLGLDGDAYAGEYDLRFASPEPAPPPRPRPGVGLVRLPVDVPIRAVAVAVAVLLLGVALWQLGGSGGSSVVRATRPAPQTRRPAQTRTHARPAAAQPSPRRPPPLLALTAARGNCWLLVRIGSSVGRTVYEGTLQQGQTARFGLRKLLWIRFGAPRNLNVTIGGRSVTAALRSRTGDLLATSAGLQPTT